MVTEPSDQNLPSDQPAAPAPDATAPDTPVPDATVAEASAPRMTAGNYRDQAVAALAPAMWLTLAFTYLGYMGGMNWIVDLFSHFRWQYLAFQAFYLVLATTTRRWVIIGACLLGAGTNVMEIAPFYLTPVTAAAKELPRFSVLQINVNSRNKLFDKVLGVIATHKPDIVCVQEVSPQWDTFLTEKLKELGYGDRIARPRTDDFGIAIYSRLPMQSSQIIESSPQGETQHFPVPAAFAVCKLGDRSVSVITVHPLPPLSERAFALRNEEFAAINAARDGKIKDPFMIVGDLNCSPWSYYFNKVLNRSKVMNTAQGFGLQTTWPSHQPIFRIPIDHVLASKDLITTNYQVLGACGSDHLPVLVHMALKPASAVEAEKGKSQVPYRH